MTGFARSLRSSVPTLLRVLVVALVLPLASAGTLPIWAQLVGVEGPHVCHCSVERHECVCPKCNPDHEGEMLLSSESLKGRCGEDDVAFGGRAIRAVLVPSLGAIAPVASRVAHALPEPDLLPIPPPPPPTPPPRFIAASFRS